MMGLTSAQVGSPFHHMRTFGCAFSALDDADVYTTLSKRMNEFQDKNKAAQYQRGGCTGDDWCARCPCAD